MCWAVNSELLFDFQLWLVEVVVVVDVLMQCRYHLYCYWRWVAAQLMVVWVQLWGNNVNSVGIVGVPFVAAAGIVHVIVAVDVPSARVEVAVVVVVMAAVVDVLDDVELAPPAPDAAAVVDAVDVGADVVAAVDVAAFDIAMFAIVV